MDGLKLADEFGGRAVLAGIENERLVAAGGEVEVEGLRQSGSRRSRKSFFLVASSSKTFSVSRSQVR